jgi:hypothetical protein
MFLQILLPTQFYERKEKQIFYIWKGKTDIWSIGRVVGEHK